MTRFPPALIRMAGLLSADSVGGGASHVGRGKSTQNAVPDRARVLKAFRGLKLVAFDCDGVIWIDEKALPGAVELIAWLKEQSISTAAITNNSSRSRSNLSSKAERLDLPLTGSEFYATNYLAAKVVEERFPGEKILVLGSDDFFQIIGNAGVTAIRTTKDISDLRNTDLEELKYAALIAGFSGSICYAELCHAVTALENGAVFIATNPDYTFPVGERYLWPGNGSFVDLVSHVSGVRPEILGKPAPHLLNAAMEDCGASPAETLMIGDRLDTDIACGKNAGAYTCLVNTGVAAAGGNDSTSGITPDFTAPNLTELLNLFKSIFEEESERKSDG